jgi:multiple sugar transport system substrate-binding protein
VELDAGSHPIDYIVMPAPVFEGGRAYAVQQGAGMVVSRSDERREYASVEFLKWFTQAEENLRFGCVSGYLPVLKEAGSTEKLDQVIADQGLSVSPKTYDCLTTIFEELEEMTLYTNKSFQNGSAARKVLEYHLADRAAEDRAGVLEAIALGKSLEEASAEYVSDGAFEDWYSAFCQALNNAVGR